MFEKEEIIKTLECCTELDGDNFPRPNCKNCPSREECKRCTAEVPYRMLRPLLKLLKGADCDAI